MTNPTLPRLLALAPKGLEGIGVVAAACRASALGIVDLCANPGTDPLPVFARLDRLKTNRWGVRVLAAQVLDESWVTRQAIEPAVVCIPVCRSTDGRFDAAVQAIRQADRTVIGEVTTHDEALRAIAAGVSGLIVAGHEAGGWGGAESSFVLLQRALAASSSAGLGARWGRANSRSGLRGSRRGGGRARWERSCWRENPLWIMNGAIGSPGGTAVRPR